jgi:hypothetical protein
MRSLRVRLRARAASPAITTSWSPSRANFAGYARVARAGGWRTRRRVLSIASSPRFRCVNGCSRFRSNFARSSRSMRRRSPHSPGCSRKRSGSGPSSCPSRRTCGPPQRARRRSCAAARRAGATNGSAFPLWLKSVVRVILQLRRVAVLRPWNAFAFLLAHPGRDAEHRGHRASPAPQGRSQPLRHLVEGRRHPRNVAQGRHRRSRRTSSAPSSSRSASPFLPSRSAPSAAASPTKPSAWTPPSSPSTARAPASTSWVP